MYRLLVCGSRTFPDRLAVQNHLNMIRRCTTGDLTIIEGGCPTGADKYAGDWARWEAGQHPNGFTFHEPHPADWDAHGKAAGPLRNQAMLDSGVDQVIAFVDKPLAESRGTNDMVFRARKAGVRTMVIEVT